MKRREFITVVGGAAVVLPLTARAQQASLPLVGFLGVRSPEESAHLVAAFQRGLGEIGYSDGQNVKIEYRWANGRYDQLPAMARDLVGNKVAVTFAAGAPAVSPAMTATSTVPIVFMTGDDPVKAGIVESFSRPGGNVTGISLLTAALEPKRFGLLNDLGLQRGTIGVLSNPTYTAVATQLNDIQNIAQAIGRQLFVFHASNDHEIDTAFAALAQNGITALLVLSDPFFNTRRDKLTSLSAREAVPAIYPLREYAMAGGLMSYGIDLPDAYRQTGNYVGQILKGARPGDLPVLQPTKFQFVINLKTAAALRLTIPSGVLAIADEVIE